MHACTYIYIYTYIYICTPTYALFHSANSMIAVELDPSEVQLAPLERAVESQRSLGKLPRAQTRSALTLPKG